MFLRSVTNLVYAFTIVKLSMEWLVRESGGQDGKVEAVKVINEEVGGGSGEVKGEVRQGESRR